MTLDKAIEYTKQSLPLLKDTLGDTEREALQLSFEALKRVKEQRHYPFTALIRLLPSETVE